MTTRRGGWVRGVWTRRLALLVATVAVVPLVFVVRQDAQAADTVTCATQAQVFAAEPGGVLWRYPFNAPASATGAFAARAQIGAGWQMYPRVLGGTGGRVYGINKDGVYRYRWLGAAGWEVVNGSTRQLISTGFDQYATPAYRNKITIDGSNDIYLIDGLGRLLTYRYDEAHKTWLWSGRVLDNGWDRYDLIVAGSTGVIFARTPDGKLFRHRYDAASQRWIGKPLQVGSGWNTFAKGIFAVGGDVLFGIKADGTIYQYHYREDNNTWPIVGRKVGNGGWQNFANVLGITDGCKLTVSHTPAKPTTPVQDAAPTGALYAAPTGAQTSGSLEYAFTDSIGRLVHGRQNPDAISDVQWTTLSGTDSFTGVPALSTGPQGRVQILGHNAGSDVWTRRQSAPDSPAWDTWNDLGGAMKSEPVVVTLSDGKQAAFALDATGAAWVRPQDAAGTELAAWRVVSGTGLTGPLVAVAAPNRGVTLIANTAAGTPQTAVYREGTVSAWTSLGGAGLTGTPAAVVLPGPKLRLFARDGEGHLVTQVQGDTGTFPGGWTAIGEQTVAGSPAAVLHPITGKIDVIARNTDGSMHVSREVGQGTGQFAPLSDPPTDGFVAATDPTVVVYHNANGPAYLFAARNADHVMRVWLAGNGQSLAATAPRSAFTGRTLPAPPAR